MRRLLMFGLGLWVLAALWEAEEEADGPFIALSPLLTALAIELSIFFLRRPQNQIPGSGAARRE
jgi:hypothetical protein